MSAQRFPSVGFLMFALPLTSALSPWLRQPAANFSDWSRKLRRRQVAICSGCVPLQLTVALQYTSPTEQDLPVDQPTPKAIFSFGRFEIDTERGELRKDGVKIKLQTQPLQLLLVLLDRPGSVVTREELRRKLWPDDTFVDFDHGLNAAVKRLREALGESAESSVYIQTFARRGYSFQGSVATPQSVLAPHKDLGL